MKKIEGIEPQVPELPPFELSEMEENANLIEEIKKKRKYIITLKVKKTATSYHKIINLDDGTDLDLTLKLIK